MDFRADMMGDQSNNTFAIGGRQPFTGIFEATREPIDPEPAVRIEHDLGNRGLLQPSRDRGPECRSQHACATRRRLGSFGLYRHPSPHRLDRHSRSIRGDE